MNTEMKVDCGATVGTRGWVAFDALCPVCSALRDRWHPVFAPLGFPFVPLQDSDIARELHLAPGELPGEIQLLLADGRRLGGTDAMFYLAKQVGWLVPFGWVADLPGIRAVVDRTYAWVARNRHCLGDACRAPLRRRHRGHEAFFEAP